MIRFFSTMKELREIASRVRRERIMEPVEKRPVCSKCHLQKVDLLSDGRPVRGVMVGNKVYCKEDALAYLRAKNSELNEAELEKRLSLYEGEGITQLYVYTPENHNQPV